MAERWWNDGEFRERRPKNARWAYNRPYPSGPTENCDQVFLERLAHLDDLAQVARTMVRKCLDQVMEG